MPDWYAPQGGLAVIEDGRPPGPQGQAGPDDLDDRAELVAQRRARRRARTRRVVTGAAGIGALLVLWQAAAMILADQVALPSVTQTVAQFAHYLNRPYPAQGKPLWFDLYISLRRILVGFVIGVAAGIAVGSAMSASRVVRHLIDPVIEILRPLPPLAFIPLFIVWLGIGETPKEVLIIVGVVPLMAVMTVAALDEVPDDLRLCARTLGASRAYTLLHVQIRAALPYILTGMRLAMAGAWSSIVAVEMIAATSGLGYMIMQAGDYLDTALAFAGIITIAIIALIIDAGLRGLLLLADPSRRG
ncbi:MAG TPA: ABC transporter permease [Streptosporangiaceae bacterium]|jgi:NitT/TauT family transport system permease protein/taurine transport system permease protein